MHVAAPAEVDRGPEEQADPEALRIAEPHAREQRDTAPGRPLRQR